MMLPEDHAYLAGLRDTTATALAEAILPGPVALLDVPNQGSGHQQHRERIVQGFPDDVGPRGVPGADADRAGWHAVVDRLHAHIMATLLGVELWGN